MPELLNRLKTALADRYAIERELGSGGMAIVYLADDLKHARKVAIKVLRPELAAVLGAKRLLEEIAFTAKLQHPHIVPLFDSGEADSFLYYVMPYFEGESLREMLNREKQLSIDEAVRIASEVAGALHYAHEQNVIHRDIKPGNILLSEGHAVIADFGLARAITASGGEALTTSGIIIGTPVYMSPEQAGGEEVIDGRTDIYALGCVLYEMLAGEPPFTGPTTNAILAKHVLEPVPALEALRPGAPPAVVQAVEKALAKTPADRYATGADFATALSAADTQVQSAFARLTEAFAVLARGRAGRRSFVALLILAALAFGFAIPRLLGPGDAYQVEDARRTFIVLPHRAGRGSPEEDVLAQKAENELTRLLTGWKDARVVPSVSKVGLMFDLELVDPLRASLRQSIALAREAKVGTLITLIVTIRQDSAYLEAQLHDVATASRLGDPLSSASSASDVFALVAPIAARILDFSGAPAQIFSFQRESNNLEAIRLLQEGRQSLDRWRLERAERSFRATLEQDSTFARAHYFLALTLYWQAVRDVLRFPGLGGEIRRHASAARRHGAQLVHRDSLFVDAFFAFQSGDFQGARELYNELVRTDSTDTYAWLLLGSVEYQDFWAEEGPDGVFRPRGNLNRARRAFTRTVRLSPDFFLGYGHLFDIYGRLANAIRAGGCYGYERPSDKVVLIWERRDPRNQAYSCPVVRDSIEWVDSPTLAMMDKQPLLAGAGRFLEEALIELGRWSDYAPEDPRPEEELSAWLLARRDLLPRTTDPATHDSLAAEALRHTERAMALTQDTVPEDLIRLGELHLAGGDIQRALFVTQQGIDAAAAAVGADSRLLPDMAANVFLATGQVTRALEVALPVAATRRLTVHDSGDNRRYDVMAEPVLARLRVFGATALGGAPLRDAFAQMERVWTEAGYDERQKRVIRKAMTVWIRPALILDEESMTDWFAGWEPSEPALAGLLALRYSRSVAREWLDRGTDNLRGDVPSPSRAYLLGVLAQQLGEHEQAIEFFDAVLGPLRLRTFTAEWGLRSISHLRRATSYEAVGDTVGARRHYSRFVELWENADAELQPLVTEARERLERLQ